MQRTVSCPRAERAAPVLLEVLQSLDARHDEVLAGLDELNERVEHVLAQVRPAAQEGADEAPQGRGRRAARRRR